MYRTRLNPPPANGWTPDPALVAVPEPPTALSTEPSAVQEDLVLVAPDPPQSRLDFAPEPPTKRPQHLLINGEPAVFVRKRKEDGKLYITARIKATGKEKVFTVPPAKVKILEDM